MAIDAGTLVVKLTTETDKFKKGLDDAKGSLQSFGSSTAKWIGDHKLAITAGAAAITAFAVKSVQAYGESEEAVMRLTQAVGGPAAKSLAALAQELQRTTTYSDEAVMSIQAQLANYGVLPGSVKAATVAIVDYAARTGKDLPAATAIFTQALAGQDRELKKYGLQLEDGATRSENLARVTAFMTEKFQGAAVQMAGTTLGSMTNLKNRISELQETIGKELIPVVSAWTGWLEKAVGFFERLTGAQRNELTVSELAIQSLTRKKDMYKMALQGHMEYRNSLAQEEGQQALSDVYLRQRLVMTTNQISILKEKAAAEKTAGDAAVAAGTMAIGVTTQETVHLQTSVGERIKLAQIEARARIMAEHEVWVNAQFEASERTAFSSKMYEALSEHAGTWSNFAISSAKMVTDKMGTGVAQMLLEGKKFSDVMKSLWKDMAAEFIKQVARMIAKWIAFQALKMAATGGFGGFFAEGGMIREPSLITGLHSGVQHIAGEAGPEAIVPQNKGASSRNGHFQDGGGSGGGITINVTVPITGQFIEGSPSKWQEMIRSTVVPEFRRWAMSHPNELVNRKRGSS